MKRFLLIPLAIILVTALIFGGCKPAAEVPEEIRIGCTTALTGPLAGAGIGSSFGVLAATEDINKEGGIYLDGYGKKLPVKLILVDTESAPIKAGTLAEDLILRDEVHAVTCGMQPPDFVSPAAISCERYKTPLISGIGPYEPWQGLRLSVTPTWKYTWALGYVVGTPAPPGDFREGNPGYLAVNIWLDALGAHADQTNKRVAALIEDDPDGRGWYMGFGPAIAAAGFDVYRLEDDFGIVPLNTTDFSPLIEEWKDNDCQILIGLTTAPFLTTFLRQAHMMGYKPKMAFPAKAVLFYQDIAAMGGDLPMGLSIEWFWDPIIQDSPGIAGTTPQSLYERWHEESGEPLNQFIGVGYSPAQVLFDAIERAGILDADAINKAIGETDLMTIYHRVVFTKEDQFNRQPITFAQWQKVDKPEVWEAKIVHSFHDFIPTTGEFIFPIPYD